MIKEKDTISTLITAILFIIACLTTVFMMFSNNALLFMIIYIIIDVGFMISLFVGIKSTNKNTRIFSAIANFVLIIPVSILIIVLLFIYEFSR